MCKRFVSLDSETGRAGNLARGILVVALLEAWLALESWIILGRHLSEKHHSHAGF